MASNESNDVKIKGLQSITLLLCLIEKRGESLPMTGFVLYVPGPGKANPLSMLEKIS